ncbi:MAG TPA: hypothetical protein VHD35_12765 [Chitinophagaceae bacterium]|nr:hypothetical protein [Chitinophagaceae bacterium]
MRKKIYKWHRTLSLIISVPVILWASSGFMHPIMTNIRPHIATQSYNAPGIDSSQLKRSLQQCLQENKIDSFNNVHIVQMGGQQFYQVILDDNDSDIRYISTRTGHLLKNGDELYARFLAKFFLEGSGKKDSLAIEPMAASDRDCCIMATTNVMNSSGSKIIAVSKLSHFNEEYKYINRLLPVYKVSFSRNDGIRIYVETASARFGFAVDNKRAAFETFFGICHTWEWMNSLGNTKYFIMVAITLTGFLTTLLGLYIFFTTKTKRSDHSLVKARRNHRYTSLVASLFTLLFTFSGGFHALDQILPKDKLPDHLHQSIAAATIGQDFKKLDSLVAHRAIQNISICRMNDKQYWQLYLKRSSKAFDGRTDLMKNMSVSLPDVVYVELPGYTVLQNGDEQYARYLASGFSNNSFEKIKTVMPVTTFTNEYNFIDKRLPVWKVGYAVNDNERFYVETSTGFLSTRIRDKDLWENYSFNFLHKHHFMDWGGKTVRDASTMFWAAMQIAMVIVGLILYFRYRKRKASSA